MLRHNFKIITSTISLELKGLVCRSEKSLHLQETQFKDLAHHIPITPLLQTCHWISFLSFGVMSSISLTSSWLLIIKLKWPILTFKESPNFNLERLRNVCFVQGRVGCFHDQLGNQWENLTKASVFFTSLVHFRLLSWWAGGLGFCFPCIKSLCIRG